MLAASLATGLQLLLVFIGLCMIVLSVVGTVKAQSRSKPFQAGVRSDAVQIIGLGTALIAGAGVWAAIAADLPTTTKVLIAVAVLVIVVGIIGAEAAGANNKRVVFVLTTAAAVVLIVASFLVGAYEEFVR